MAIIKFRGKQLYDQAETAKTYASEKGTWRYGTYTYAHKYRGGEHGYLINDIYGRPMMCDENTIGQCTGLKDKKGIEMFDGDNVLLAGKKGVIIIDEKGTSIKWQESEYVEITDYLYKMCDTYDFDIEVIGNIHDKEVK